MSVSPTFNHKQKVWTLSLHIYLNSLFADYFKNNSFGDAQIVIWGGGADWKSETLLFCTPT